MRKLALPLLASLVLASCATLDKETLSRTEARAPLPPLKLELGFDIFMARVDLRRGVHDEVELRDNLTEKRVQKENEYNPLVIDLGGGLILDRNGNLGLDLLRLYGLAGSESFTIVSQGAAFGSSKVTYEVADGKYRIERRMMGTSIERGTISPTEVANADRSLVITLEKDEVVAEKRNILGMRSSESIKKYSDKEVAIPALIGEASFVLGDGFIELDKGTTITHRGNSIEINAKGYNGIYKLTLARLGDSLYGFDGSYRGFELRREGDTVKYLVNGSLVRTYTLADKK